MKTMGKVILAFLVVLGVFCLWGLGLLASDPKTSRQALQAALDVFEAAKAKTEESKRGAETSDG